MLESTTTKTVIKTKSSKKRWGKINWDGYLYILPVFIFLIVFIYFGIGYNFVISLFKWDGIGDMEFVRLGNYIKMFHDSLFHASLNHTFLFLLVTIPGSMFIGLLFSILLHSGTIAVNLAKSIFFLPYVMAIIVIGIIFQMIYEPNFGLLNQFLSSIGLESLTRQWIGAKETALYSIAVVYIYTHVGFYMLIYYTGILNIDGEVFEAARIDGASIIKQITHVVIPMLKGTHMTLLILGVIASLKVFELVWVMTEGGPGGATELVSTYVFRQALLEFKQGYSAAVSVILLIIAFIYTIFQLKTYKKSRSE